MPAFDERLELASEEGLLVPNDSFKEVQRWRYELKHGSWLSLIQKASVAYSGSD